jgi:hypothetical protein
MIALGPAWTQWGVWVNGSNRDKLLPLLWAALVGALSGSVLILALMQLRGGRRHGTERPSVSVASTPERRSKWDARTGIASWISVGIAVLALIQTHDQTPVVITGSSIASPSPTPLRTASGHQGFSRPEQIGADPELGTGAGTAQEVGQATAHGMSASAMKLTPVNVIMDD